MVASIIQPYWIGYSTQQVYYYAILECLLNESRKWRNCFYTLIFKRVFALQFRFYRKAKNWKISWHSWKIWTLREGEKEIVVHFPHVFVSCSRTGILLPKLFWPNVGKNCSSDREKLLKFKAEGREFVFFFEITRTIYSNSERPEQFLVT